MPERLMQRGSVYYFRAKYPADLRGEFPSPDRWKSLGTRDLREARLKVRAESVRFDAEMAELRKRAGQPRRMELTSKEIDAIAAAYFHELMEEDEEHRTRGLTDRDVVSKSDSIAFVTPAVRADLARGDISDHEWEFNDWLESNGHKLDAEAPVYRKVHMRLLKEFVRYMDAVAKRHEGEPVDTPPPPEPAKTGLTVRELIDGYLSDPGSKRNSKTLLSYRIVFDTLAEIVGEDRPASAVTRADCERVRDIMLRLPSNARKKYPGVSLEMAVSLGAKDGAPVLNPGTINGYLNNLAALFNWGVETWRVERNPAKGLAVHDPVSDKDKRQAIPLQDLPRLFSTPLYLGCLDDEAGYAVPGPNHPRRGRFWVPLLSLFHGLRLAEACQLHVSDVQQKDGTWLLLLSDEGTKDMDAEDRKRIKTEAGRRYVPLHPELELIGFVEFAEEARQAGRTRLFPEVQRDTHGYFSGFSKWFARYLEKCEVKGARITFHSFRHSYRDALRRAEVPRDVAQALGGWASQGTDDNYGSGLDPASLGRYVARVRYDGLDLSGLADITAPRP